MLVQYFEPQGKRFTNFHYYYLSFMPCQLQLTSRQMHKHQCERTKTYAYMPTYSHTGGLHVHICTRPHTRQRRNFPCCCFSLNSLLFHTMSAMTGTSRQTHKHQGERTKTYAYMPTCSHTGGLYTYIYMHMSSHKAKKELLVCFFLLDAVFFLCHVSHDS